MMARKPAKSDKMLLAALRYAALGWPVLPLLGKKPHGSIAPNGSHDATTDEATIRDWWARDDRANIGLATGIKFWVLDVDVKNAGDETLDEWESQFGKLPDTILQMTGTNGRHYLFMLPSSFTVTNSQGALGTGIDTRGTGGYIVAAPSVHPDTHKEYFWDGIVEIEAQSILPAPEWLLTKIRDKQRKGSAPSVIPIKIPKGVQHATLVSIAGSLRRRGHEYAEILAILSVTNRDRCSEPGPIENIEQIARSVCKYEPGKLPHIFFSELKEHEALSTEPSEDSSSVVLPDWRGLLKRSMRRMANGHMEPGAPLTHVLNAALPLQFDPAYHGAIAWDQLRRQMVIRRAVPFEPTAPCLWEDKHDIAYASWCQQEGLNISPITASQAVRLVAEMRSYHPVADYLNSLSWDGTPRISYWLPRYCGADDTLYTQMVGRKWLIAAVARALCPGCKVDTCLILEGKQGIMKSTALSVLGGDWHTDEIEDLTSKDAAQQVSRVWIVEMGELSAMSRSEKTAVKAFLTRSVDQFRPAYGRHVVTMPRQCVFAGTTNQDEYLEDETGNRRFWPVRCVEIHIEELRCDRDQLWAEAAAAFMDGEPWWISDDATQEVANTEVNERLREDPWTDRILPWVDARVAGLRPGITTADVLGLCLEIKERDWKRTDQMRVAAILRHLGLVRRRVRDDGVLAWQYVKLGGYID